MIPDDSRPGYPVHPHGCGEHSQISYIDKSLRRFIPTGVGNTPALVSLMPFVSGSSPRVWGTPGVALRFAARYRFIPTGVGNTRRNVTLLLLTAVHPHGCGEHALGYDRIYNRYGSSPRVWGTRPVNNCVRLRWRFIPTGVGNTPIITD